MLRNLLIILCLSFVTQSLDAQQLPIFTQYREHLSQINPAMVNADYVGYNGIAPNSSAGISYRQQWSGFKDAPKTITGRYEHLMEDYSMLFGGNILKDQTGPTGTQGIYLRYAYQLQFDNYASFLSIGVLGGFLQYSFDGKSSLLRDPGDLVGLNQYNINYSEFNVGLYFQHELDNRSGDIFYAGFSVPQFAVLAFGKGDLPFDRVPHFYGQVGLYKFLSDGIWGIDGSVFVEPSLWIKYVQNTPAQMDANFRLQIGDIFWIGAGYSMSLLDKVYGNNAHFETGFSIGSQSERLLKVGLGFDRSITTYGPQFGNVLELNMTYSWFRD